MSYEAVTRWERRLKLIKISTIAIIVSAVLSLSVIAVTVYAENVGNFVINVAEKDERSLALCEEAAFPQNYVMLSAAAMESMDNITYGNIPHDIDTLGGGTHNYEDKYLAYSFYLKNTSDVAVDVNARINITSDYKGVYKAIRVMVIKDGERAIYALPRADGLPERHLSSQTSTPYVTVPFISQYEVMSDYIEGFGADETTAYTVVMWLEGWDDDCIDVIMGGSIRMNMTFSIVDMVD